jgi:K+-transporting ATPase ATPase C chain
MWEQILPALRINLFATVIFGLIYPLGVTGICQVFFSRQANGSLVMMGDKVVGSDLIGQNFGKTEYFHPRPSSAGNGYDATSSSGSNLGPTSAKLIHGTTKTDDKKNEVVDFDGISLRLVHFCLENDVPYESSQTLDGFKDAKGDLDDVKLIKAFNDEKAPLVFTAKAPIPADAITASGSGLDPHISPETARLQTARVAKARGVSADQVTQVISQYTEQPTLGILGDPRVNVLRLNLALDQRWPAKR